MRDLSAIASSGLRTQPNIFVVGLGVDAGRATKTWPGCAFRSARSAHLLPIRSAAMDFAPVWSPRLLRTESAGRRREAKLTDKQHLEAMLTALDASPRALERIGDWQIVGNNGHIMTDGRGFVFYVSTSESPRRWTGIKKRLGFCRLTQDGDDEGCLYLERLPKADEAVLIREAIGIRKRRHLTPEALVALERARAAIKTPFRGDSVRQNEVPATTLPESKAA
jgi:hypothetical protein